MIKLENVSFSFGLSNISCRIPQGKLIGIMGANGAGKSTLLKGIAGILPPASGEIWLEHCKLSEMSAKQKSERLAYFAQNTRIHWDLSVYDVIALGLPTPTKDESAKVRSISAQFFFHIYSKNRFNNFQAANKPVCNWPVAALNKLRCCSPMNPLHRSILIIKSI